MRPIRIGVVGAGHLGKIHLERIREIDAFDLVGVFDTDEEVRRTVSDDLGLHAFDTLDDLIEASDAVDIVSPTLSHHETAVRAIQRSRHVFIEKPMTADLDEAAELVRLVDEAGIKAQVGHVERFNPALLAIRDRALKPMFIETHRLAQFNPRGTDVSVIYDLMIHDIDIILQMVGAGVKRIDASGVPIISESPDIANARIEFDNGCVANVTASRISIKNMRKTRIFQRDAYISVDFLERKSEIFRLGDSAADDGSSFELDMGGDKPAKFIHFETPDVPEVNAIGMELELFARAIQDDVEPPVTVTDAYQALEVASGVLERISRLHFT